MWVHMAIIASCVTKPIQALKLQKFDCNLVETLSKSREICFIICKEFTNLMIRSGMNVGKGLPIKRHMWVT